MSYFAQAALAFDGDFASRVTACASTQAFAAADPVTWAADHRWQIAAAPGFADAYSSAIAGDVERPGADQAVISDEQILSAVQTLGA